MITIIKIENAKKEITAVLRRYNLSWSDITPAQYHWELLTQKKPVNLAQWEKAAGILKRKKIPNPVAWQRKMRADRKLPRLKLS